jgi:DNA-binding transcriptional regulator YhcF (GntR family)
MLPFKVVFKPGLSVYQQAAYAARKAVVSGQLRPGDLFPSVRALSQALKINPNTAHKVVSELTREGLLDVRPGLGTVVAERPQASPQQRTALLQHDLEQLVVEAKRLFIGLDELVEAVEEHWERLSPSAKPATRLAKERQ